MLPRLDTLIVTGVETVQTERFGGELCRRRALIVEGLALHRESSQKLEMVLATDVFGPSEGVLVEPGDFAVPVDGAVDALAGRGARVAVVGLCAVELFSAAFVHRVTCRDFEFQAFDDFPSESGVGVEVVDYGLAVLVLSCFQRVETVNVMMEKLE